MDSTPSTSKVSPVKKCTCLNLGHLSVSEKQCILNKYKQILSDTPQMKITTIVKKIADTAGVAKSTVYRTIKEHRETGAVTPCTSSGGRLHVVAMYDETTKKCVRQIIYNFFHNNELRTLDKILKEVQSRSDFPWMC